MFALLIIIIMKRFSSKSNVKFYSYTIQCKNAVDVNIKIFQEEVTEEIELPKLRIVIILYLNINTVYSCPHTVATVREGEGLISH